MSHRVLVAGIGNLFLTDDGFGSEVVRRMAEPADGPADGPVPEADGPVPEADGPVPEADGPVPEADGPVPEGVRIVDYGIRGMHLAYDLLEGYDALVLVDALPGKGAPGDLTVLQVGQDDLGAGDIDAHGMDPFAVLSSLGTLGGRLPTTYVVGCQPASVEEGIGLTEPVEAAVPSAIQAVRRLLEGPLADEPSPTRAGRR